MSCDRQSYGEHEIDAGRCCYCGALVLDAERTAAQFICADCGHTLTQCRCFDEFAKDSMPSACKEEER